MLTRDLESEIRYCRGLSRKHFPSIMEVDRYDIFQDYVISAINTLKGLSERDREENLDDESYLRLLLNSIYLNKCRDFIRHETRQKRGSGKVICIDFLLEGRENSKESYVPVRLLRFSEKTPEEVDEDEENKSRLEHELKRLSPRDAFIIGEYYYKGNPYKQIADKLGKTETSIRQRSQGIKRILRKRLKACA